MDTCSEVSWLRLFFSFSCFTYLEWTKFSEEDLWTSSCLEFLDSGSQWCCLSGNKPESSLWIWIRTMESPTGGKETYCGEIIAFKMINRIISLFYLFVCNINWFNMILKTVIYQLIILVNRCNFIFTFIRRLFKNTFNAKLLSFLRMSPGLSAIKRNLNL